MNKYTMKIFDNETGKLVDSIDYNTIVAGFSRGVDGQIIGSSLANAYGSAYSIAMALDSADVAQQELMKKSPKLGIAYMMIKGTRKESVATNGTDKEHTD